MLCNDFIINFLNFMSYLCTRLQDDSIKLHIQIELNNHQIFTYINFFQNIKNEYQYKWHQVELNVSKDTYDIVKTKEYKGFYKFITDKKLFTNDELEWVEDAIHEVLIS